MVTTYAVIRLLKLLAVLAYVTGSTGAALTRDFEDRKRLAYVLGVPGFCLTWALGVALTWQGGVPLLSLWVLGTMALSMLSLNGVLFLAGKAERGGPISRSLVIVPLVLCVALMSLKP